MTGCCNQSKLNLTMCWACPVCSPRCRTSVSAMTAVGWWSVLFVAPRTSFPSIRTVERHAPEPTCFHAWSIAWAASRRALGWRRSSRSWAVNRAAGVAPFLDFLVARLDHRYMVSKHMLFWENKWCVLWQVLPRHLNLILGFYRDRAHLKKYCHMHILSLSFPLSLNTYTSLYIYSRGKN